MHVLRVYSTMHALTMGSARRRYASRDLKRNAPDKVKAFTRSYLTDQDQLQLFIEQKCVTGQRCDAADKYICTTALLQAYNEWAGEEFLTARAMAAKMASKGFEKKRVREGSDLIQAFMGIKFVEA